MTASPFTSNPIKYQTALTRIKSVEKARDDALAEVVRLRAELGRVRLMLRAANFYVTPGSSDRSEISAYLYTLNPPAELDSITQTAAQPGETRNVNSEGQEP